PPPRRRSAAGAEIVESKFELFVVDAAKSSEFYRLLGFSVVHEKADGYTTLRSGTTVVALSPVPWWLPLRVVGFLRYPPIGTEIAFYTEHLAQLRHELIAGVFSP